MSQLIFRAIFILFDMIGNAYILRTHQTLTLGTLPLDNFWLIVLFNAAMIAIICIVDYIIVKVQRLRIDLEVGEGLTDLHKHER